MSQESSLSFAGTAYVCAEPFDIRDEVYDPGVPQFFLHVPKTGGTTVHFVLMAALAAAIEAGKSSYRRFRVPRVAGTSPIHIAAGWTGSWSEVEKAAINNEPPVRGAFYSAHCPFGFHRIIGYERARYFALVRDPVARELSSFNFQYQRGYIRHSLTFQDYLEINAPLDNPQVRMFAGPDAMTGPCTERTYEVALANIQSSFGLIASVRQSLEFIRALLGLYGLPAVAFVRSQVTGKKALASVHGELEIRLREFHSFDGRLVEQVEANWQNWLSRCTVERPPLGLNDDVLVVGPDFSSTRTATSRPRSCFAGYSADDDALVELLASETRAGT